MPEGGKWWPSTMGPETEPSPTTAELCSVILRLDGSLLIQVLPLSGGS